MSDVNNVDRGLVISDKAKDDLDNKEGETKGNQFMWIPVEDYSKFHLIEGYYKGNLDTMLSKASNPSREAGASKTEIHLGKPNEANTVLGSNESTAIV